MTFKEGWEVVEKGFVRVPSSHFESLEVESTENIVGVPDGFQRLWTPYRMAYVQSGEEREQFSSDEKCPFCVAVEMSDEESLIVHRGETCYAILNLYPYNSGHMLICPYRHVPHYTDLTELERIEFGELTAKAMRVERRSANPDGFNIGMNQGSAAGAGLANHLHQHVVPRWSGDTNFFPIVAQTKTIPQILGDTRQSLVKSWESVED